MNNDELYWRLKAVELQQQEIIANQQKTANTLRQNSIEPMPDWFLVLKGTLTLILMIATTSLLIAGFKNMSEFEEWEETTILEYRYEDVDRKLK